MEVETRLDDTSSDDCTRKAVGYRKEWKKSKIKEFLIGLEI